MKAKMLLRHVRQSIRMRLALAFVLLLGHERERVSVLQRSHVGRRWASGPCAGT
jgi:hypothetical protein